jgi:penicillin-binding protein 1B
VPSRRKGKHDGGLWKAAVVLFVLFVLLGLLLAERSIGPLLSGDVTGAYPTRVYSAPARLRAGESLTAEDLEARLLRLRYVRAERPARPGEFSRADLPAPSAGPVLPGRIGADRRPVSRFELHTRGFAAPTQREEPSELSIEVVGGRVQSVSLMGAGTAPRVPVLEAWLEPELLFELSGERRVRRERLEAVEVPRTMADAVVAVEDRRFFRHHGVDPRAMARAAFKNAREGRYAEGASTLTQQLARSLFLSPRRTLRRKLQEVFIALYLDARFPKTEVLRMYLDTVYFGQDGPVSLLGLKAAARHFFDKAPARLSLGEAALLAGLLRSPYNYDPFRNPQAAAARRRVVLAAMRREGFIDAVQEKSADAEPVSAAAPPRPAPRASDYFVAFVQRQLERRYGDAALLSRGLSVYTTLDTRLQALAVRAVRGAKHPAALVALDPRSGAVRALVGGRDFSREPYDRATLARRQPGSAFKPFVYAAALTGEDSSGPPRWTAASVLLDAPRRFRTPTGDWSPRNHEDRYLGRVPVRTALAQSLNLATLDLAEKVGVARLADTARRLGIRSPLRPELGTALGASEVTLLELSSAYCAFANGGFRVEPYAVESAMDPDGEMLEYHARAEEPVLTPEEAWLMTDLLREVVRTGTAKELRRWDLADSAAGKTGTTNDGKDAWFVGSLPRLSAGVWTGSDLPTGLGLVGARDALPVWAEFMAAASTGALHEAWPRPEGLSAVEVDPESGLRVKSGCPSRRTEFFLPGTEPRSECPLHSGGISGWFQRVFKGDGKGAGAHR